MLSNLRQSVGSLLLDLVFPPSCVSCQRNGQSICDSCAQLVEPAELRQECLHCGREIPEVEVGLGSECPRCQAPLGLLRIASLHTGPMQSAIHALKYGGREELAPSLARYLRAVSAETPWPSLLKALDGIVPVPMHEERLRERRYNQAGLLAACFAESAGRPFLEKAILCLHPTRSQVGLSRDERADNVQGKFRAVSELVKGKSLLLVDDVFTTGSTMRACAEAMRDAGADAILGLALAGPRRESNVQLH